MTTLLAGAGPYVLTKTWFVDGTAQDVGDVTIGVVDANGDTVIAAGTATTNNADGTYTYSLADQADVNDLTVTWTRVSTGADLADRIELIGGRLFTEAQARAFDGSALASTTTYPDADINDERDRIVQELEQWTGRAWVPRYARIEAAGNGSRWLSLFDAECVDSNGRTLARPGRLLDVSRLLSVTVGGTSVATANVEVRGARLYRKDTVWPVPSVSDPFNVVVEYEYGLPAGTNGSDRVGMLLLRDRLVSSMIDDRALSFDTELGTTRFVNAGGPEMNMTRLPEVNAWLAANDSRLRFG